MIAKGINNLWDHPAFQHLHAHLRNKITFTVIQLHGWKPSSEFNDSAEAKQKLQLWLLLQELVYNGEFRRKHFHLYLHHTKINAFHQMEVNVWVYSDICELLFLIFTSCGGYFWRTHMNMLFLGRKKLLMFAICCFWGVQLVQVLMFLPSAASSTRDKW